MFHVGDIMVPRSSIFSLRHAIILHFVPFLYPYLRCNLSSSFLILSRLFPTEMSLMFTVRIKRRKKEMESSSFSNTIRLRHLYTKVPFLSFPSQSPFFATAIWYDHVCLGFNVTAEKRRTPYRFLLPSVENFEKFNE